MDQQLKEALELHQQKKPDEALVLYQTILKRENPPLPAFLNASSIWRSQEKPELSVRCLKRGLSIYPAEPGLWNNLGNCHLDAQSLAHAVVCYRRALGLQPEFTDARISLATCFRELGHAHLAYACLSDRYRDSSENEERQRLLIPLLEAMLALAAQGTGTFAPNVLEPLVQSVEAEVRRNAGSEDPFRGSILMTQLWLQINQLDRAIASREKVIQDVQNFFNQTDKKHLKLKKTFHASWHNLSWNLAIHLLKQGRLEEGWRLYEHGLQVVAAGPQRWQRSLKKPFTPSEVPFWRGESLTGKRLLLLGEQGIGDSMMFTTLIPRLQEEGAVISLFPGDRLLSIYQRSLPTVNVVSNNDLLKGHLKASNFDLQSPLGSICQHRFHHLTDYGLCKSFLKADPDKTAKLRQRYSDGRPLIGISWQGGGKANRIALKSLKLKQLSPLLKLPDYRFVSLQYGDDGPHLERFRNATGIDVFHDDEIDPLRDMDGWLSQVAAMDAVISIANTTIHGAGGLGIPTLCLVSQQSDWRWIHPEIYKGCYWYPSVDACYQATRGDWQPVVVSAVKWLEQRLSPSLAA